MQQLMTTCRGGQQRQKGVKWGQWVRVNNDVDGENGLRTIGPPGTLGTNWT